MGGLIARLRSVTGNELVRAAGLLVSGTALAQLIFAVSMPIATRLYSPADFALLALFTAIVQIVAVAACLRLDIAIPIAREDNEAVNVLVLALGFATLIGIPALAVALTWPQGVAGLLNRPDFEPYLWLVAVGILAASYYSAFQYWLVRRKAYRGIATNRVMQAVGAAAVMIGFGYFDPTPLGLLLGFAVNAGAGFIGLGWRFLRDDGQLLGAVSRPALGAALAANSRFPKYSTFEALCNNAAIYLPVILIGSLSPGAEAGYVILAMQIMQAPISLIGSAVAQVYLSRSPEEFYAGRLGPFTATMLGGLVRTGVGPLLFAGIVAPDAFAVIFGQEWRPAGELVRWMTPWFVMQFLSSPVSMALHVTGNQRAAMLLQLGGLVLRVGMLYLAHLLWGKHLAETYALSGFVFYLVYLVIILRVVSGQVEHGWLARRENLLTTGAWVGLGLVVLIIYRTLAGS